jgi:hypothetical protein
MATETGEPGIGEHFLSERPPVPWRRRQPALRRPSRRARAVARWRGTLRRNDGEVVRVGGGAGPINLHRLYAETVFAWGADRDNFISDYS